MLTCAMDDADGGVWGVVEKSGNAGGVWFEGKAEIGAGGEGQGKGWVGYGQKGGGAVGGKKEREREVGWGR